MTFGFWPDGEILWIFLLLLIFIIGIILLDDRRLIPFRPVHVLLLLIGPVAVRASEVSLAVLNVDLALEKAHHLVVQGVGLRLILLRGGIGADPWNVTISTIVVLEHSR